MPKSRLTETLMGVVTLVGFIQLFDCNVKRMGAVPLKNRLLWAVRAFRA